MIINSIEEIKEFAATRRAEIRTARDNLSIAGKTYYVSADGDDKNDGRSPESAWKTLEKVSAAELLPGDGVLFQRGDLFRGMVVAKPGVSYGAYGEGETPRIYGGPCDLANPELWISYDPSRGIWKYRDKVTDCGTLVFNHGEAHSRKLIPSYRHGKFVCRDNEKQDFDVRTEMTLDLDIFCHYDANLTKIPSKGEDFPVPVMDKQCYGDLYLRCDKGNPGEVFDSIEAITWLPAFYVRRSDNVRIDNICIKYAKFGVSAAGVSVRGLKVTNCEIGWIGGNIQNYLGLDPNYIPGKRGSVTRYGNGVEIYGGCDDYEVSNCYIYQSYDAGITHQISTRGNKYELKNILYRDNLIENCVYSIEYFLERENGDTESLIKNCKICGNVMLDSGYGWGQQRHNVNTPAHVKGWSYENTAKDFEITDNVFAGAAYRMIHIVAKEEGSLPTMRKNTYAQKIGFTLGQYGANHDGEPPILPFDENAKDVIATTLCEPDANIVVIPDGDARVFNT